MMLYAGLFSLMLYMTISPRKEELGVRIQFGGWKAKVRGTTLTGLSERLVVEFGRPDFEGVPFLSVDPLVDVDHIQVLVL